MSWVDKAHRKHKVDKLVKEVLSNRENKGSAFKDGEYREFCWQWCLVMVMINPKKSNPNRDYAKKLWKGERE